MEHVFVNVQMEHLVAVVHLLNQSIVTAAILLASVLYVDVQQVILVKQMEAVNL
jgi:hypothetical protein